MSYDIDEKDRGKIVNRDRATQINDFHNIRYGKITPTDLDGFIDYHGALFIYFEIKYKDTQLHFGQKLALERLCDASQSGGIKSYLIISRHGVENPNEDVDVSQTLVSDLRYCRQWYDMKMSRTLDSVIDEIIQKQIALEAS